MIIERVETPWLNALLAISLGLALVAAVTIIVAALRQPVHTALEQLWVWWATEAYHWFHHMPGKWVRP